LHANEDQVGKHQQVSSARGQQLLGARLAVPGD
jgi:hypothetical protein